MTRSAKQEIALFFALVVAGALFRVAFYTWFDLPNFAPVAAISLFAGYYFRSASLAILVAPAIMLASDCYIGFYRWELMATVYGMLTLPVAARPLMKRVFQLDQPSPLAAGGSFLGLVGCSLIASIAFFLVTNMVVWAEGRFYSTDAAGLIRCYLQALPFFRNTLLGDLFFSCFLFGSYAAILRGNWTTVNQGQMKLAPVVVRK